MSKRVKDLIVNELKGSFGEITEAVVIDYSSLGAEETRDFRNHLRSSGIAMNVVKNTLIRRVFDGRGMKLDPQSLQGPTAIVWGAEDAITASKAVADWRKKNKKPLPLKAGIMDGEPLAPAEAEQLTKLPSTQDLRAMVVGAIAGPLTHTVGVLSNTLAALPRLIQAIHEKKEEA